ncbi:MAG TPA: energy transducer TonB [Pyrinomonadaceae bacterium]|nr:energy transducer TonB [Pyrinomonadaceae bacterium]
MMKYRLVRLTVICATALLFAQSPHGFPHSHLNLSATQSQWIAFVPQDEDFTATIPAGPTMRNYPIYNNGPFDKREKVLAHHEYSGYGDGLIFVIQSYKAEHPEKLAANQLNLINETDVFQRIQLGDVTADLFHTIVPSRFASYTKQTLRFMTPKHLYVIGLMTLEENNPSVDRFITGIKMRSSGDRVTPIEARVENPSTNVWSAKDVTRKAVVVWKSEPWYTDAARAHRVVGTVVVQAVFGENGYVSDITVVRGLKDGLDESAIDAARNIRFFPAEKDGKRVGQRTQLEFNFDLY